MRGWKVMRTLTWRQRRERDVVRIVATISTLLAFGCSVDHGSMVEEPLDLSVSDDAAIDLGGTDAMIPGPGDDLSHPTTPEDAGAAAGVGVAQGNCHGCAWRDGRVWCWGANTFGALGDTTKTSRPTAAPVQGLDGKFVVQVAVGCSNPAVTGHSCALTDKGEVWCWGANGTGQLGDQSGADQQLPVKVVGLGDATAVAVGAGHSCALTKSGSVVCWGDNQYFQIGDGSGMNQPAPTAANGLSDAVEIAAGYWHTCARRASGALACWGPNAYGEIGNGSPDAAKTPAAVATIADAVQIVAGVTHSCARRGNGTAWCWGSGQNGSLGNGMTPQEQRTPIQVSLPFSPVALAIDSAVCARQYGGAVWCWGLEPGAGGASMVVSTPAQIGSLSDAYFIAGHCATRTSGKVSCWGFDDSGQLGDGTMTASATPVDVQGL
jgi:alpha-tubulin suppressor-like RCC1 family protein